MNGKFRLTKLEIKNLLSHKDTVIEFDETDNFILCHGRDLDKFTYAGAGKSCIENAVTYALFGRAFRGQTSGSINNEKLVSNWARVSKEPLNINLLLSNNRDEIEINRQMVYGVPTGTSTSLLINGQSPKDFSTPQAPAKYLMDKIIQLDYKTFSKIHSFRTGNQVQFFSLRGMEQIDILEKFVSKVNFFEMGKVISGDMEVVKSKIQTLIRDRGIIESKLESLKLHKKEYVDTQKKKLQKRIDIAKEKYVNSRKNLEKIKNNLSKLHTKQDKIDSIKESLKIMQKEMRDSVNTIKNDRKRVKQFHNLLQNIQCPTCLQDINKDLIETIILDKEQAINVITDKIVKSKNNFDKTNETYKKIWDKIQRIESKKVPLLQKKSKFETKITFYINEVNECQKEIDKMETTPPNIFDEQTVDLKKQMTNIKRSLTNEEKKLARMQICFDSLKKKSPLKQYILKPLMPIFSNLMNKYFPILWGSDIKGEVVITPNNNVDFLIHEGYSADEYESASSGECRIIDIAALLSFMEFANILNRTTLGFMILDEVLESMDKVLAIKVVQLLKDFAVRKNVQILFITNNSVVIESQRKFNLFDRELVFQKKDGITTLLENPEDVVEFD